MQRALRILLVEDLEADAQRLIAELRRGGFAPTWERVDTADGMRAALARAAWDVVCSARATPAFTALDALAVLKQVDAHIPLLLVSRAITAEQAVELFKAGIGDYVNKADLSPLVTAVERALRQATELRQQQRAAEECRLLATAAAMAANAIFITNPCGEILWTNAAFRRLSGFNDEELAGQNPRLLESSVQPQSFYEELWRTILAGQTWTGELVERHKNGNLYTVQQTITPLRDKEGKVSHFVAIHEDITRRKEAEARIEHMAYHDALTGLPNRTLFLDRLRQAVAQAKRNARLVGVHFVDLDRFKLINDTMGHACGDRLLQQVTRRLQDCVRAIDTMGRLAGDEFAIIQMDLASVDGAAKLARKIFEALAQPFHLEGQRVHVGASVGIAIFPLDDPDGRRLLEKADMALYRAKAQGRNCFAYFTPALDAEVRARREVETGLIEALAGGQLLLHYQPQMDLVTQEIVGMEALLRWQHPSRGLLLPATFLSAAESCGLIDPMTEYVMRQGCMQNQAWQRESAPRLRLAINVSASHLRNDQLLASVAHALSESGLSPRYLELELTESALIQDEVNAAKVVGELARLGVLFSIDDFGTGFSSLKYLKQLSIQKLKIDQSFVRNLPHDPDDAAIVRATIALGHELGLRVLAEGVETDEQLVFLREHGCDEGQGFFFNRPMPPSSMGSLLNRSGVSLPAAAAVH